MELPKININEAKDTGLAIILILLIIEYLRRPGWLVLGSMAVLVFDHDISCCFQAIGQDMVCFLPFSWHHCLENTFNSGIFSGFYPDKDDPKNNGGWPYENQTIEEKRRLCFSETRALVFCQ